MSEQTMQTILKVFLDHDRFLTDNAMNQMYECYKRGVTNFDFINGTKELLLLGLVVSIKTSEDLTRFALADPQSYKMCLQESK